MIDHLLQFLGVISATIIFWNAEAAINKMAPAMRITIRLAFWLLVVGSAAFAVKIWQGYVPPIGVVFTLGGVALLLTGERRKKVTQ